MKRIAVYCGSATPADPVYIEAARMVGRTLAERGIGVVYGGGKLGLMGAVAGSALAAGGEVIGIIGRNGVSGQPFGTRDNLMGGQQCGLTVRRQFSRQDPAIDRVCHPSDQAGAFKRHDNGLHRLRRHEGPPCQFGI